MSTIFSFFKLFTNKCLQFQFSNSSQIKCLHRPGRGLASRAGRDPGQPCQAEGEEGAGRPRRRRVGGQEQEGQGSHHHLLRDIFVKPG